MKVLITGAQGFVGKHLCQELQNNKYEVVGLGRRQSDDTICVDLLDADAVNNAMQAVAPDVVFHLAAQADVGISWKYPAKTMETNAVASINLLEAIRKYCPEARVVLIGSSDEYGKLGEDGASVSEDLPLRPQTPYAISKRAQEDMAKLFVNTYGMNICMTRSFNHYGVGQREGFLIPDLAAGIVRVEKGIRHTLHVGNLDSRRDFTHVRDVVKAYRLIAEKGLPGEIYNVGSGVTYSAKEVLEMMLTLSKCQINVEQDLIKMRPSDTPIICCNHNKLTHDTGWLPTICMEKALGEIIQSWREQL